MAQNEIPVIAHVQQLLAGRGYEVTEVGGDVLRARDVDTGIAFQAALQDNVLYMSVVLKKVPSAEITPELMHRMLAADNGISTSAFQLYDDGAGGTSITLNNFCTLQNMGPEDQDDILSLASYLMADVLEARDLLEGTAQSATQAR
jgi:hypothetical protein